MKLQSCVVSYEEKGWEKLPPLAPDFWWKIDSED